MSELNQLKEAVYDDVVSTVNSYTANPHSHVIREDDDEPESPPMVALNGSTRPRGSQNAKSGVHTYLVLDVMSNPFDVKYGRERTFSVDVTIADVDGTRAGNILEAIQNTFTYSAQFNDPSNFINSVDIDDIRVENTSPISRDQRVGNTLAIEIDYLRTFNLSDVDNPPTEVTKVVQNYDSFPLKVTSDENGVTVEETN